MIKKIIWFFVLPIVVGVSVYFIFFRKHDDVPTNTNNDTNNTQTDDTNTKTNTSDIADKDDANVAPQPLTGFSTNKQEIGMDTNGVASLTIDEISNTSTTSYHEFRFKITSDHMDSPYVTAEYLASSGVIRLSFNDVTKDNGGLGYQKSINVNKEGVLRLYHNVSSSFEGEIYDVGISNQTPFKLSAELGNNDESWYVTLSVQYPGEGTSVVDLGSTEFSTEAQSITGVQKDVKATVASYSYSSASGVVKFVWSVSSTDTNPIPTVSAAYDASNQLVVTFASLSVDKVVSAVNGKTLPGGISIASAKSGDSSIYTFKGISSNLSYKLSASTGPNQVVLEIKL